MFPSLLGGAGAAVVGRVRPGLGSWASLLRARPAGRCGRSELGQDGGLQPVGCEGCLPFFAGSAGREGAGWPLLRVHKRCSERGPH